MTWPARSARSTAYAGICRELTSDLVLMDIGLPGMDGLAGNELGAPSASGPGDRPTQPPRSETRPPGFGIFLICFAGPLDLAAAAQEALLAAHEAAHRLAPADRIP
ncbi:hypothetical protein DFAR_2910055 [Desulfarculales bacterium]